MAKRIAKVSGKPAAIRTVGRRPQKKRVVARIKSVGDSRMRRANVSNGIAMLSGIAGGIRTFNYADIPSMLEDDQISLGLEYLKNPIAQAPIAIRVSKQEAYGYAADLVQRVWNALIPKLDISFAFGEACYEPLYKTDPKYIGCWDFHDFDIAPPMSAIPWINSDKIAFAAVHESGPVSGYSYFWFETDSLPEGVTILEGAGKMRPSKVLWIPNDCLLSRWFGRSVLRASHKPWKAKQMPDGALENFLKATYRAAFSGLLIKYPANQSVVAEDGTIVSSEQYADFLCQVIKSGSNVRLPASVKDSPGWEIIDYGKNLVDFDKLQTPLDYFDRAMLRGMGIPDEIITHDGNTGGYSRSLVAVDAFYARGETRAACILPHVIDYIVAPLVRQRFGLDCEVYAHVMRQQRPDDSAADGDANNNGVPDALEGAMQHDKNQEGGSGSDGQNNFPEGGKPSKFSILMSAINTASRDALTHDYSSTQLDLDAVSAGLVKILTDTIDRNDLAEKGVEDKPHITVKYGLHTNEAAPVEKIVRAFAGPIDVVLGDVSLFRSDNFDVLKIDVNSDSLRKLNDKLCRLPHSDEHDEYHPHLTLAYLKPGMGEKYLGDTSLLDRRMRFDSVTFSDKRRDKIKIPMGSF